MSNELSREQFRTEVERWLAYVAVDGAKIPLAVSGLMTSFDLALRALDSPEREGQRLYEALHRLCHLKQIRCHDQDSTGCRAGRDAGC